MAPRHFSRPKARAAAYAALCGLSLTFSACVARLGSEPEGTATAGGKLPGGLRLRGAPELYRVVRLTHAQWENSVRDVLLLSEAPGVSETFISDPPDGLFSNNERALYVTDTLSADYIRAAETLAASVAGDPTRLSKLSAPGDSAGFVASVGRRAFRRALSPEEQAAYATLWAAGPTFFESGDAFADGARAFLEAVLLSPHFVYRVELSPAGSRLSGTELATKISYLLRNTTPDAALLDAAESGALDTDEGVLNYVTGLLEEEGAKQAFTTFHSELFGLDRYRSILKNTATFPAFSEALNPVLIEADVRFFEHMYTANLGFRDILTSNLAFVNDATAAFYGLTGAGPELTATTLDGSRPGFLTRVGFLAYNANLNEPDPIHRGVDINNRLLCAHLEPPAGEIPALPTPIPGQTNRERVVAHTSEGFCANCHNEIINPPGFALEAFDAMGQIRTTDNGKPIDTTGTFLIGDEPVPFTNINELTQELASRELTHSCYAAHLAEFAFGRDLSAEDAQLVSAIQTRSLQDSASLKALLLATVTSPEFSRARSPSP